MLFIQLIFGSISARDLMSYSNFSSSYKESLIALCELLATFSSVFLAATFVWLRQSISIRFVVACFATTLVFISNGTRSTILLLLIAVFVALLSRPPSTKNYQRKTNVILLIRSLISLIIMGGLIVGVTTVMQARFANDPYQEEHIVINSVASNNDMFRELMFSILNGNNYRSDGVLFLETPITYAMPSFLGFEKAIPPHLIDFNFDRAGIDIVNGEGNVFPGLIADMYLCFGDLGPVVLAVLSALFFWVFWWVTLRRNCSAIGGGLFVTLLAYYVICFRNLQGSLGILVVASYALSVLLASPRRGPMSLPSRAFKAYESC